MTQQNLRHLTPDQVERFQLDGCLTVEDVLTPDEVAALAAHTDRIAAGELDHIPDTSIQLEPVFPSRRKSRHRPSAGRAQIVQHSGVRRRDVGPRHPPQNRRHRR